MKRTLKQVIEKISCHYPKKLLSDEWLSSIYSVAQYFPSNITKQMIFEANFCTDQPKTDFAFHIDKNDISKLTVHCESSEYGNYFIDPHWQRLLSFCRNWTERDSTLHNFMDYLWLEFDIRNNMPQKPELLMFFQINKSFYEQKTILIDTFLETLQFISNNEFSSQLYENIMLCYNNLFNNLKIKYIGFLPARKNNIVRLCITNINLKEIFIYLKLIGLDIDMTPLNNLLYDLNDFLYEYVLHLDVGKTIQDKIGIELQLQRPFNDRQKWLPVIDYLKKTQDVNKEKLTAVQNFWEKTHEHNIPELKDYYTYSYLFYIKTVYQPKQPLLFKGYLANFNMPFK